MKKVVFFGIAAVMAVGVSIAAFASGDAADQHESVCVESSMQGRGPCTYPNCKCPKFNQRPGYNQCWCGHQSFVHK